jgi:hypothetical protein
MPYAGYAPTYANGAPKPASAMRPNMPYAATVPLNAGVVQAFVAKWPASQLDKLEGRKNLCNK